MKQAVAVEKKDIQKWMAVQVTKSKYYYFFRKDPNVIVKAVKKLIMPNRNLTDLPKHLVYPGNKT